MNTTLIILQAANAAQSLVTDSETLTPILTAEREINLFDMAIKGGWIMIILALLAAVSFYILFERVYAIRKAGKEEPVFMNKIRDYVLNGEIKTAINYCRMTNTPSARMIEKGIHCIGRPGNDVLSAVENVGNIEVVKLEKGLPIMATIAGGAPMIGFLGTVTGMVRAFYTMANAGNNIDITLLSGGIYEAMITTVGGLIVGIIAMFAYNYLVSLVGNVVNNMETKTMEFMDVLNERKQS
jgi:biopolymer transport protein ExbB